MHYRFLTRNWNNENGSFFKLADKTGKGEEQDDIAGHKLLQQKFGVAKKTYHPTI
jgi:hypothetical protein